MSVTTGPAKPTTYERFTIGNSMEGWEVVDNDGRPVSPSMEYGECVPIKNDLNQAAANGHRALASALGAIDDPA